MQSRSLGTRIAIFGGGGKTALAGAIAEKFDLPHIELDAIKHGPNWVEDPAAVQEPDYTRSGWSEALRDKPREFAQRPDLES